MVTATPVQRQSTFSKIWNVLKIVGVVIGVLLGIGVGMLCLMADTPGGGGANVQFGSAGTAAPVRPAMPMPVPMGGGRM